MGRNKMMPEQLPEIEIIRDDPVEPDEIEALREAVGWERSDGTYSRVLERHYAHYTARENAKNLVGYVSVLSDGVADAFLLDLMVHPQHQKAGLGTRLVTQVIADMKATGIQCVQVTFSKELTAFYEQCGFHIFSGGIIDFRHMDWQA